MKININHCIDTDDIVKRLEDLQGKDIIDMYGIPIISVLQDTIYSLLYFEKELNLCKKKLSEETSKKNLFKRAFLKTNVLKNQYKYYKQKYKEYEECGLTETKLKSIYNIKNCFGYFMCENEDGMQCAEHDHCMQATAGHYERCSMRELYKLYQGNFQRFPVGMSRDWIVKRLKEAAEGRIKKGFSDDFYDYVCEKGSDALKDNLKRYKAAFLKANWEKRKAKKHEEDILCEIAPILAKEGLSIPNCFGKGACSSGCACILECKKACDCEYEGLSYLALYKIYEIKNNKIPYGKTKSEILEELKNEA